MNRILVKVEVFSFFFCVEVYDFKRVWNYSQRTLVFYRCN